jgi:hypothetical protein
MHLSLEADLEVGDPVTTRGRDTIERPMIEPKTIIVSRDDNADSADSTEWESYSQADAALRKCIAIANKADRLNFHVVVVFRDLFVWRSSLSLSREDATRENFVQRAIQADWEFNAGVRPRWWPNHPEAKRIWGVHYREDRDNGRAELARMRLARYDLSPVVLTALPPRDSPDGRDWARLGL